jgi:hypothetical protein
MKPSIYRNYKCDMGCPQPVIGGIQTGWKEDKTVKLAYYCSEHYRQKDKIKQAVFQSEHTLVNDMYYVKNPIQKKLL